MTQTTLFDKTPFVHKDEHFTEEQKRNAKTNAMWQESRIMEFWQKEQRWCFTASYLWQQLAKPNEPLTSFRRALTNLAKQGKIEKMPDVRKGLYGRNEHLWRLKRDA